MKKTFPAFALCGLGILTSAQAQTDLYINAFGAPPSVPAAYFVDPDTLSVGTSKGLWRVYDATYISGPSPTYLSNLNGSPSPDGDNYWMGQMQGVNNFSAILGDGSIQSAALIDAAGSPASLLHGESYVVHFWMNPFENVTDDGASGTYSTGALPFTITGSAVVDTSATVLATDMSYTKSVPFGSWTDLAVPFTYDSAWGTNFRVSVGSTPLYGGSLVVSPTIISGGSAPPINRVQSVAVDFGLPVPEPSGVMLIAAAALTGLVRRRR